VGGLVVCELGFCSCWWFDDVTDQQQVLVTRRRAKTAYRTGPVLSPSAYSRADMIQVGLDRSNPGTPPLRMVSVLWQGTWDRDLPNGLDPQPLSARQVGALYRRRWRIEAAFALTKRVLDVAYWWTGATHAVQ
jgi:IS4 transposase